MQFTYNEAYFWSAKVLASLRHALERHDFDEILPAILSERYEPGARHSIAILGDQARPTISEKRSTDGAGKTVSVTGSQFYFLPVSHCVEKQLALEHMERVYCIAPCVRLLMEGEDISGRHLCTFFQAEIEWRTEDVENVYATTESILSTLAESLLSVLQTAGALTQAAEARISSFRSTPYARIAFADARERVKTTGGMVNPHAAGDLTYAEEQALSHSEDAPLWLTDYPDGVRDSLYRQRPDGTLATYDLILPGGFGEVATGGLRPDSVDAIEAQAHKLGETPHPYYGNWKRRTDVQTGGLGFGVERLVRYCAGADSVLDLRYAHDQGPNAAIAAAKERAA